MIITHEGQAFRLLPEKALFWENAGTLVVSDVHIGKLAHFRNAGIAVPAGGAVKNLEILTRLIHKLNPRELIFTGDLFHSDENQEWESFFNWRRGHATVNMKLVRGNHDRIGIETTLNNNIEVFENELITENVVFGHYPKEAPVQDQIHICGHVHPVIRLQRRGLDSLRIPCFLIQSRQIVLPAFGYFTGGFVVEPQKGERAILIVNDKLINFQPSERALPISKK